MNKNFNFLINKEKKPQYFSLLLKDHKAFFDYICTYKTIFELSDKLQDHPTQQILIQVGKLDWLLRSFKRSNQEMENNLRLNNPNIQIVQHNFLGHLLSKKISLDINLNNQMITNKDVIKKTIEFINS